MIITKLQGGLGNQLFQWAYGKKLSEIHNTPLYLDLSFYKNQNHRSFSLDKFNNLEYNIFDNNNTKPSNVIRVTDDFNYKEFSYSNDRDYYLDGYWQSEKYFKEIGNIIKECLRPETHPTIEGVSVSIHIRRTDYITSNGYHPVQPIEYYQKALDIIGNYDKILIFSDDIQWCKNNLNFDNMIFIENKDEVEDMWLMSLCTHNVIANSSFSWWGAWLNNNPNKKVIYPSKWFGDHVNLNMSDIICDGWITCDLD
jgi:hypothetical protein